MIAKILSSTGSFSAVNYNTNKIDKNKGELMAIKNISHLTDVKNVSPETIKDYLKTISNNNKRVKNPQFHCAISCKEKEYNKNELTDIAHKYMSKMGYEKQPYLIIFHSDTENNHVHIVSSRIDENGNKISDSNERYKSKRSIDEIMEKDYKIEKDNGLPVLLNYKCSNFNQLKTLLEKNNYIVSLADKNMNVYQNGKLLESIEVDKIQYFENKDISRNKQIAALVQKYSKEYSPNLSPVYSKLKGDRDGQIIGYESELTKFLNTKFGLDFVFHFSESKKPFGYTIIDNKNKSVLKGSEVLKMQNLIGENIIERQKNINKKLTLVNSYNINNLDHIKILAKYYKVPEYQIKNNDKTLNEKDISYYKNLMERFLKNNNFNEISKLNLTPIVENGNLYFLDKTNLNIITATDILREEEIKEYLGIENSLADNAIEKSSPINFGWSLVNDVDDAKVHGKERNKKTKGR